MRRASPQFLDTLHRGTDALERLLTRLAKDGTRDGRWLDFETERAWGELTGLLSRLRDTTPDDWAHAASWFSPLDALEIRNAVTAATHVGSTMAQPILPDDRLALKSLATLLDRHTATGKTE